MHQDRLESTGLFLLPQPNFETISCRIQIVSPCAQGTDWSAPDYITNLLTLVTNIPSRSSLRASSNDDLFQPRIEQRTDDRALHSLSPHLVHEIAYRHNWNSCGRRQQRWGAIWSLFIFARHGDYVMHLQADCRRCKFCCYYYCYKTSEMLPYDPSVNCFLSETVCRCYLSMLHCITVINLCCCQERLLLVNKFLLTYKEQPFLYLYPTPKSKSHWAVRLKNCGLPVNCCFMHMCLCLWLQVSLDTQCYSI